MDKKVFYGILLVSLLFSYFFGCNDRPGIFIVCVGSFATLATFSIAYEIFLNYSATADVQQKQFELVNDALTVFIKKRFTVKQMGLTIIAILPKAA